MGGSNLAFADCNFLLRSIAFASFEGPAIICEMGGERLTFETLPSTPGANLPDSVTETVGSQPGCTPLTGSTSPLSRPLGGRDGGTSSTFCHAIVGHFFQAWPAKQIWQTCSLPQLFLQLPSTLLNGKRICLPLCIVASTTPFGNCGLPPLALPLPLPFGDFMLPEPLALFEPPFGFCSFFTFGKLL